MIPGESRPGRCMPVRLVPAKHYLTDDRVSSFIMSSCDSFPRSGPKLRTDRPSKAKLKIKKRKRPWRGLETFDR
jgi:hypothetical protein